MSSGPHGPGFLNFFGVFDDMKAIPTSQPCLARGVLFNKLLISQIHLLGVPVHYASLCMEERPNHHGLLPQPSGKTQGSIAGWHLCVSADGGKHLYAGEL